MLSSLSIQNFLVIDRIEIEFDGSLNIITGETGAGKTIIIEALKLLLGERLSKDYFRDNKEVIIEACFTNIKETLTKELCEVFSIDDDVYIRREISSNGKNKIFINNRRAMLKDIKNISNNLIEFSGQYENQRLLNKAYHLQYLDELIDKSYLEEYKSKYDKYINISKKYNQLLEEKKLFEKNREYLMYQKNELECANINIDEDIHLDEKIRRLNSLEKTKKEIISTLDCLKYGDANISTLSGLVLKELENLKIIYDELNEYYDKFYDLSMSCSEIALMLEKILNKADIEQFNLDELVQRKFLLEQLKRKYNRDLKGLVELKEGISNSLDEYYVKEGQLKLLEEEVNIAKNEIYSCANALRTERKKAAVELEKLVLTFFEDLGLNGATFSVVFNSLDNCTLKGIDDVEFYIATNAGFDALPINKVASGGELSRILLTLKEIFSEFEGTETIIFDEIDTGVSGVTAKKVAQKLKALSRTKQLVIITHLPVIAAIGSTHYHLVKREIGGKAVTDIVRLSNEKREEALAAMISGKITESSIYQAKELLRA